jgi:lipopolysaccharide/colanic/teichoic acid biosynthesis glycosyltransferase
MPFDSGEFRKLIVREASVRAGRGSFFEQLRSQMLAGLLVAVLLPAVAISAAVGEGLLAIQALNNSMIGCSFAVWFGLILVRRVSAFPGSRMFGFILPSFATSYGVVLTVFLLMRLDYSNVYFALSFAFVLGIAFLTGHWIERYGSRRFFVVPTGQIDLVLDIPNVEWVILDKPEVPAEPGAAIVADLHFDHEDEWERMLAEAAICGRAVYHTKMLQESLTGRVAINHLSENSFGSLVPNLAYRKFKRLFDIALSIALLPILILPLVIVALLVRLDSTGPILFVQERMGYRGQPFRMFKFRTMHVRNPVADAAAAREEAITVTDDKRVTRIGRFLRHSRIDEIPQIINVLRGEMSWIGPRPEAVQLSLWYEAELPFYRYRHIVRPGISGWAQVNQGHVASLVDVHQKLHFDFYYIKNFSAWLDILISLRTIHIMMTGFGSK